jgi:polysaccharide deacetylase family protein (PEP-CTERM system associated)
MTMLPNSEAYSLEDVTAVPGVSGGAIVNALSVDVEDYFHVSAFSETVRREEWGDYESRVSRSTDRLLSIFADAGVHATFFVLGWVAEREPALVRRIAELGHEVACHGYEHRLVYEQTPDEFRRDVRRAKQALEGLTSRPVLGYRAPSFSITIRSLWALDVLVEEGFAYDASIFPIHHDRYGIPTAPRRPHAIRRPAGTILEVPGSTVRLLGLNLPVGGGGYFRFMPYGLTKFGISRLNRVERVPAVFYVHPWEVDPEQPRLPAPLVSRLRHYRNLGKTESRLRALVRELPFDTISALLGLRTAS